MTTIHSNHVIVAPGTLVTYDRLGIQVNADYNPDATFGDQPYVTVNTETLDGNYRYDPRTGLLASTTDVFTAETNDGPGMIDAFVVVGPDGPVAAFNGHTPGFSNRHMAENLANILNGEWPDQCGMPAINVMINDQDIFDDQGAGDTIDHLSEQTVYVVHSYVADDEPAVFAKEQDAQAFAATYEPEAAIMSLMVAGPGLAAEMIAERTDDPIKERLEELREIVRSESISYGELAELQGLAEHIDHDDVELLEAAGVPEHADDNTEGN